MIEQFISAVKEEQRTIMHGLVESPVASYEAYLKQAYKHQGLEQALQILLALRSPEEDDPN